MFDKNRIFELQSKNMLYKKHNNLENYKILTDVIEIGSHNSLEVNLWLDGNISVRNISSNLDINVYTEKNRIKGIGAKIYRDEILKAIEIFHENNKEILNYINIE